ncbi:RagB/SusD family nutrient uptake outer membrane protein [Spirosoma areae]
MKRYTRLYSLNRLLSGGLIVFLSFAGSACNDDFLEEIPVGSLNPDVVLTTKTGFENYITGLHVAAREEFAGFDALHGHVTMNMGTDVGTPSLPTYNFVDYNVTLVPSYQGAQYYWDWAYTRMLSRANTIITYAQKPEINGIWANEAEKNAVLAEARFFRAYTHNVLANLYGGVPVVEQIFTGPKTDFVRDTRKEVYESAMKDLVFASQWLPKTVDKSREGRIVKAAADHLLAEVYISLGEYDKASASASDVINSGLYKLMTTRFGSDKDLPGDVFSDLFKDNNTNRSSGNQETIYVLQIEDQTPGGKPVTSIYDNNTNSGGTGGNHWLRAWGPFYANLKDPAGKSGMVLVDSMGRGVGWIRPTNYVLYDIWKDNFTNDMRNSPYNIRRTFKYTNPASTFFGKTVGKLTADVDTMQSLYPTIRKIEGKVGKTTDNTYGKTFKDYPVMRLAETYLLRAEAYLLKGDKQKAADDINVVRARANAKPATASEMSLDYILDERARELIVEEQRRRTLTRMGKLVERVRKYSIRASTRTTIQDKHGLFPIPQSAIDANFSAKLEQNPGY